MRTESIGTSSPLSHVNAAEWNGIVKQSLMAQLRIPLSTNAAKETSADHENELDLRKALLRMAMHLEDCDLRSVGST